MVKFINNITRNNNKNIIMMPSYITMGPRTLKSLTIILLIISPTLSSDNMQRFNNNHSNNNHNSNNNSSRANSIVKRRFAENFDDELIRPSAAAAVTATSSTIINHSGGSSSSSGGSRSSGVGGCGSCRMREEIKNRNLEIIKSEVLRRMGFQQAPNVTGRILPPVPSHYLAKVDQEFGGMQSDAPSPFKTGYSFTEEEDDFHVKTQAVLTFAQPYPRLRHGWREHDILHFMFSDTLTKYHVSNATLYVYIKGTDRRPSPDVLIEVFKVYKAPDHPDTPGLYRMVTKKIIQPVGKGDWIKLDFTITVSEWFKNPRENYGFVVNATANGRKVVITDTTLDNGGKAPFVEVSTMEARRRTRRNAGMNCDEKTTENICCRYPLTVDFESFGWDFIIAPKRYDAHYCSGDCPMLTLQKYAHTHLAKIASPSTPQPCCAPRKMSPISMLYFDEHYNVVFGSLPGMVVDRCGCS